MCKSSYSEENKKETLGTQLLIDIQYGAMYTLTHKYKQNYIQIYHLTKKYNKKTMN